MNEQFFLFLHSLANRSEFLDGTIVFLAEYLPWIVIAAAVIFLWIHIDTSRKNKAQEIIAIFITSTSAYILAIIFKVLYAIDRPGAALDNIAPLFIKHDYAFPSGHATFFFALAMAIYFHHKKAGIWFFVIATFISLARVAAGAHFPGDILGGALLGILIAYLLKKI